LYVLAEAAVVVVTGVVDVTTGPLAAEVTAVPPTVEFTATIGVVGGGVVRMMH
jgi:hypothetical protein